MFNIMRIKILYITSVIGLLLGSTAIAQESTREERIKALERLKAEDSEWSKNSLSTLSNSLPENISTLTLPPLSVFLDAVVENATVKRTQAAIDQAKNDLSLQKRDWWNLIRLNGSYSYGKYNIVGNASDEFTPMYQTTMSNAQHSYNVGASVGIPFGEFTNRKKKLKKYQYEIEQLQYTKEEIIENRQLMILEAYNTVTQLLATIKAKAETAALYNAQVKIIEYNFIQGKIDISTLAIERARRSGAVTEYEQARVELHNAITLLEMLTNVKVIQDK